MTPEECVKAARLDDALRLLQDRIRSNPSRASDRVFLFELLSLLGLWDRAANQLSVAGELDASLLLTSQVYRQVIDCEKVRREVFAGERSPLILGEPEPWMALLVEASRVLAQGRPLESAELRASALDAAPASAGTLNGESFQWIADLDSRLGPCLEMMIDGQYYWVPVPRLRELHIEAPVNLRDLLWAATTVRWENGGESTALLPVRYPGTEDQNDAALRLSRRTEWVEHPGQTFCGLGQRILGTDTAELPLLELRHLVVGPAGEAERGSAAP
jgi:type VI secretion system protein ImpE